MVLESRSTLIVMVTALVEKGRQKCAKYWPPVNESLEINSNISIKTVSEETDTSNIIVYRQIELTDIAVSIPVFYTAMVYNLMYFLRNLLKNKVLFDHPISYS
jgi:protein tyrosine phosphatase